MGFRPGDIISDAAINQFLPGNDVFTYTPILTAGTTNPNLGSGGDFMQMGRYWFSSGGEVQVIIRLRFGTSGVNAGSGIYAISLPVDVDLTVFEPGVQIGTVAPFGTVSMRDNSNVAGSEIGVALPQSANQCRIHVANGAAAANAVPWIWAASDAISIYARYRWA